MCAEHCLYLAPEAPHHPSPGILEVILGRQESELGCAMCDTHGPYFIIMDIF